MGCFWLLAKWNVLAETEAVAAVEAGLKQAAENKRRKIGNPKKQKKMKTATAVALLAEFPSAPVTPVLDQTTVVTPMVKTLLDYCVFFVYGTFSDVHTVWTVNVLS